MDHHPTLDADALLAHRDWIRALARTLVSDASRADDLAQETWLEASTRPPRDARNVRSWLARVARNLARADARAESRRVRRERQVARDEALPDSAELVAQASMHRALVGHVIELDEPYRSTVLLRFFRNLEVSEIAEHQGVPLNTVRTRLQRALEQLRARLDREWGDRSNWCAALLALSPASHHASWTATLSAVAASAWKIAAVVALVTLGAWWYRNPSGTSTGGAPIAGHEVRSSSPPTSAKSDDRQPSSDHSTDRSVVAASRASASTNPSPPHSNIFEGRVVDVRGRPVPSVQLGIGISVATSDKTGAFRLEASEQSREPRIVGERWALVSDGWRAQPREHIYIVAPAVDIAGIVTSADGTPEADVYVERYATRRSLREFPWTLEGGSDNPTTSAITGTDGRFRLERVAFVPGESIQARRFNQVASASAPMPDRSRDDLVLKLGSRPRNDRPRIRGHVLDAAGRPVANALVTFSNEDTRSDGQGRFELLVENFDEDVALTATTRGYVPAVIDAFGRALQKIQRESDEPSIDDVILQLGGPALSISGRVVDAEGKPCAGWRVGLQDGAPLGNSTMTLEGVTAGHRTDHDFPITDANGSFTVAGLRVRSYRLRAWDESSCLVVIGESVPAGSTDVELRVPIDAVRSRIRGRVVSSSGERVSGAHVALVRVRDRMRATTTFATCREVTTDSAGRFELRDVPRREMWLAVSGVHIDGNPEQSIAADAGDDELELVVTLVCRVHVVLDPADPADAFAVLDASGKRLNVQAQTSFAISFEHHVRRDADGFPLCKIPDTARTLVLYQGETELRRVPIELHAGDLQTITP
jgi:RNA polymerase sigma-70 factor (ECF subfamily)